MIADLHADSLLWARDLTARGRRGHVDIPRLIEGNVALQLFTVVTKTPRSLNMERNDDQSDDITLLAIVQRWPIKTWGSLKERALYQARKLHQAADRSGGRLVVIKTQVDLTRYLERRRKQPEITAGLLGIEGAHALEGDLKNLDVFFDAGIRMIAPTHFFDNDIGGSAHGIKKGGLTSLGRAMIRKMEEMRILVDLAHASPLVIRDTLSIATRPVVVSHTGVQGTCNNRRNLSDGELQGIARTGGLIGIGFWITAVCGHEVSHIARAIRYTADKIGVDHVALGSDFDGAIAPPFDATGLVQLTEALLAQGFSDQEIAQIMGANVIRLLLQTLP